MIEETIKLNMSKYKQLISDQFKLQCLEHAGVDNWEWYDFAMEEFNAENIDE